MIESKEKKREIGLRVIGLCMVYIRGLVRGSEREREAYRMLAMYRASYRRETGEEATELMVIEAMRRRRVEMEGKEAVVANSCNQYKHEPGCNGGSDFPQHKKEEKASEKKTEEKKPEVVKKKLNLTTEQEKEFIAIKPRRDHLQKSLMARIDPGTTLPLKIEEPEVSQTVLYRKQIKEMLTDKAILASMRNGCPAEAHLEAVERTPEIIRGAKIVKYQTPTKPEDAGKIAKITHLENDFKSKRGDDFIAHWSVHHPLNRDLPPRLYFLFLRK